MGYLEWNIMKLAVSFLWFTVHRGHSTWFTILKYVCTHYFLFIFYDISVALICINTTGESNRANTQAMECGAFTIVNSHLAPKLNEICSTNSYTLYRVKICCSNIETRNCTINDNIVSSFPVSTKVKVNVYIFHRRARSVSVPPICLM